MNLSGIGMTSQRTRERLIDRLKSAGISNQALLNVIQSTPRHIFVDQALAHRAYEDTALPIGHNQTLSQPYIVARMTEILLTKSPLIKVLEVGTGSGYQTSILAQLVDSVHSVERIKPLLSKARQRLQLLGLQNIQLKHADGGYGWQDASPYDGILVTAAAPKVPEELINQLAADGHMVIPVGDDTNQELQLISKRGSSYKVQAIETVKFVPLLNGAIR